MSASTLPWSFGGYRSSGADGRAAVDGAVLGYRLAGPATAEHAIVIENGWSATYPYAVWLEAALAPHFRVLSYDRAGIGSSARSAPPTVAGMSQHLDALLAATGVQQPLIVVGHSYGGLIGALHAAQMPAGVRALVQIDPTPEFSHELTDAPMRNMPAIGRVMQLCAVLGIDRPLFLDAPRELPPEIFRLAKGGRRRLLHSLNGAIAEIRLLADIRRVIEASAAGRQCPRLVISSVQPQTKANWLQKLVLDEDRTRCYWEAVHALHRRQAEQNGAGRWMSLPYGHISLVTHQAGAAKVAAAILDFVSRLGQS
jgi:pimeloyl-ACP methyl ester carboxylesterase